MKDLINILKNIKQHVMNGVSYMIPMVATGGICIGLGVLLGHNGGVPAEGTLAYQIYSFGQTGISLMSCVIAAYIGFSIADKAAIVPGLLAGTIAQNCGAGFLGGIVAGLLNGIIIVYLKKIKFPKNLRSLQSIIFIPLVTTLVTSLFIIYGVGGLIAQLTNAFAAFFMSLDSSNLLFFCTITAGIGILDYGLFISKAQSVVTLTLLQQIDPVTSLYPANVMIMMACGLGVMVIPPIACGIATLIKPDKFSEEDKAAGLSAIVIGICGCTEGVLPFALKDYVRVTASSVIGCMLFSFLCASFGCQTMVMWSGPIAAMGMTSIKMVLQYLLSMFGCAALSGLIYALLKKKPEATETVKDDSEVQEIDNGEVVELKF